MFPERNPTIAKYDTQIDPVKIKVNVEDELSESHRSEITFLQNFIDLIKVVFLFNYHQT